MDPPKREGFQVWIPQNAQVSRFGSPKRAGFQIWTPPPQKKKTCRFPGLDPQICRFPGLDPPKRQVRAGFQQVSRFGPCTFGRVQTYKRAGPNLETCTFWGQTWKPARFKGLKPGNLQIWGVQTRKPARFGGGGSKPGNLHVLGGSNGNLHVLGGPNVETCMFWEVQAWKPARLGGSKPGNLHILGGPNLETCTFGGSKPGSLHVLGGPNLETCPAYPEIVESSGDGIIFLAPETMQYRFKDLEISTKPLRSNRDRNVWGSVRISNDGLKGPTLDSRP